MRKSNYLYTPACSTLLHSLTIMHNSTSFLGLPNIETAVYALPVYSLLVSVVRIDVYTVVDMTQFQIRTLPEGQDIDYSSSGHSYVMTLQDTVMS